MHDNIYVPRSHVKSSRTTKTHGQLPSGRHVHKESRSSRGGGGAAAQGAYYRGDLHGSGGVTGSHYIHGGREIESDFQTFHNSREPYIHPGDVKAPHGSKKFLKKVQHELEEQRNEWADEVNKLTNSSIVNPIKGQGKPEGSNSYVDTRSGVPTFKAFVNVSEFSPEGISVNVDNIQNKIIVQAQQRNSGGRVTKTFTQKVQLPRYADEANVRSFMSKKGILKIEVPLLFYFPMYALQKDGKPAKSFVNEVKTKADGQQCLEILVNTGTEYSARDLHVRVVDDFKLVITGERPSTSGHIKQKLIKQYTLPRLADVDKITSKLAKDGRLAVTVPLLRNSREGTPTPLSPPLSPMP